MKKLIMIIVLVVSTMFANAQYRNENDRAYTQNTPRFGNDRTELSRSGRINAFQRDAREHIAQGIIEGTITSREAGRLLEMAEAIERKENKYMRNGGLNNREVAELKNDLRNLDRRIFRERRDQDRQPVDNKGRNR